MPLFCASRLIFLSSADGTRICLRTNIRSTLSQSQVGHASARQLLNSNLVRLLNLESLNQQPNLLGKADLQSAVPIGGRREKFVAEGSVMRRYPSGQIKAPVPG